MSQYVFKNVEDAEDVIEEVHPISNIPDEIERDGKVYERVKYPGGSSFNLKGGGWHSDLYS